MNYEELAKQELIEMFKYQRVVFSLGSPVTYDTRYVKLSEHIVDGSEDERTYINKRQKLVHDECMEVVWYSALYHTVNDQVIVTKLERCSSYQEI